MNELPRTHPFWHGTNCRPTIYKLAELCRMRLAENREDSMALWAKAILPVWFGSNDFGQEAWAQLSHLPGFDIRWPLYAALTTHLTANWTEDQTVQFLSDANLEEESRPVLGRIAAEGEGLARSWAIRVLQLNESPSSAAQNR